ncbi:MAG: sugar phosphate isomerase/epimerase family protein, partial [Candidatus Ornithospirochaeta sp.]
MTERSVVLSALVPLTSSDMSVLDEALDVLDNTKIDAIELYVPFDDAEKAAKVIKNHRIRKVVYPIAGVQKMKGYDLCTLDEKKRIDAVYLLLRAYESAKTMGAEKLLITTGRDTLPRDRNRAMEQFMKSMDRLLPVISDIDVVLETGDRTVDARQLLGPTDEAIRATEEIRRKYPNFYLTLDTSHIAQLGEDVESSIGKGFKYSNHVHLASCILTPGHALYGDKHPFFSHNDGVLSDNRLKAIYEDVASRAEKEGKNLLVGHEVIDRSGERLGG